MCRVDSLLWTRGNPPSVFTWGREGPWCLESRKKTRQKGNGGGDSYYESQGCDFSYFDRLSYFLLLKRHPMWFVQICPPKKSKVQVLWRGEIQILCFGSAWLSYFPSPPESHPWSQMYRQHTEMNSPIKKCIVWPPCSNQGVYGLLAPFKEHVVSFLQWWRIWGSCSGEGAYGLLAAIMENMGCLL